MYRLKYISYEEKPKLKTSFILICVHATVVYQIYKYAFIYINFFVIKINGNIYLID